MVTVQFVGSGDAFGSGGRFQACISVRADDFHLLLDIGATSLTALRRAGLDPSTVDAIAVTHLHADHFGGLPFFILDAQFRRGSRPLLVAGPPGLERRVADALEICFPGSSTIQRKFETTYLELPPRIPARLGAAQVIAFETHHPSGAPAYALRVEVGDRVIAYSGDGEWSESLVAASRNADLFICEAYSLDRPIKYHLSYATLREQRPRLQCRRLILTHMGPELFERLVDVAEETAFDGLSVEL